MIAVGLMGSFLTGWLLGMIYRTFVNLLGGNID